MLKREEKLLIYTLALIQFSHIVDFMILMPLGPQLMRVFAITPAQFGMLVSCYTFTAGAAGLLSGLFIDRFDRKKALMVFYIGFCLGTLACALSPGYAALLVARTLTGAFGGVLGSMGMAIVADRISPAMRGTAMGLLGTSFSLASIAGVPFSLLLANHFGWHAPFLFLGLLSVCLIFVIALRIPTMTSHLTGGQHLHPFKVIGETLTSGPRVLGLFFMAAMMLGQFTVIPFLSPSFVANAGLPEKHLPLVYLVGGSVTMFSSPLIGRLSDHHGKRLLFTIFGVLSLVPLLIITHLGVSPLYALLALVAFFFMCIGGRMGPAMAMISSLVTMRSRGSYMSFVSSVQQFTAALGAYVAGQIVTKGAGGTLENYQYVGYLAVGFTLVALVIAQFLKPAEGHF